MYGGSTGRFVRDISMAIGWKRYVDDSPEYLRRFLSSAPFAMLPASVAADDTCNPKLGSFPC